MVRLTNAHALSISQFVRNIDFGTFYSQLRGLYGAGARYRGGFPRIHVRSGDNRHYRRRYGGVYRKRGLR